MLVGYFVMRIFLDPASAAIEAVNPSSAGYLGGLGLPVLISWGVGGLFAAGAAYLVGKITLGLRSDYLAIATLGISEIILAMLKNEDWLTRGVKNVTGMPRPIPDERVAAGRRPGSPTSPRSFGTSTTTAAAVVSRLGYACLFAVVLLVLLWLAERALRSPWGRMMRAIRDNRDAAEAMGKDVTRRHLQVFVLGSARGRHRRRDAGDARRPVHPRRLQPAALHLPDLGDGDRRRLGQQLGRGARRLPDLVPLGDGRARRHAAHGAR